MPDNDVTLYAQWTAVNYHVTYNANGGTGTQTDSTVYHYGNTVTVKNKGSLARTGYTFNGWNTKADGTGTSYAAGATFSMPASDVELFAKWKINTYTVKYIALIGGSIVGTATQTVNYGGSTTDVTATPNTGWHFAGWSDGNSNTTRHEENVKSDKIYFADFDINLYTIKYQATTGGHIGGYEPLTTPKTQVIPYGGFTLPVKAIPDAGYRFDGWDDGVSTVWRHETNVKANATYTARFIPDIAAYTVEHYTQDLTPLTDWTLAYTEDPNPTGTTGTTVYASDFVRTFTGFTFDHAEYVSGQDVAPSAMVVDDSDGDETDEGGTIAADGSLVIKLYYTRNTYTITYQSSDHGMLVGDDVEQGTDGVYYRIDTKYYGDTYDTAPTPQAYHGSHFTGWNPALPGTEDTVTADATFTAQFKKSSSNDDDDDSGVLGEKLNTEEHFAYIQGYPDNTVRPTGNVTRGEVAAVFYRLLTDTYKDTIYTTEEDFSDVKSSNWFVRYVATLANGDIITGYEDGSFKPSQPITRAELAAIASRFDNLTPFDADNFSDITGHWANELINSAAEKGWITGYPDGTFKPNQYITRAEFVTLVNNVLSRKVQAEDILSDAKQFPDLKATAWYYEAMQEAINSHYYTREDSADFEIWTEIYYPTLDM